MFGFTGGGNKVHVAITATDASLKAGLTGAGQDVDKFAAKTESRLGKTAKFIKAGFAAGAGTAIAKFAGDAVARAEEMNSAYATTAQIIEQTGGAANVTARELKDLSAEESMLTGVDKALVTEGNNVLLTFKGLRDEAGAGNDVYTRTSRVMLDMASVMGTDAKSAAVQLGKALNDPVANLGALGRAGVQFTQDQKDQIKSLAETGHLLEAQKIILGELESEFGGVAEAAADGSAKIKNSFQQIKETIGQVLVQPVDDAAQSLTDYTIVLERAKKAWEDLFGPMKDTTDQQDEFHSSVLDVIPGVQFLRQALDWEANSLLDTGDAANSAKEGIKNVRDGWETALTSFQKAEPANFAATQLAKIRGEAILAAGGLERVYDAQLALVSPAFAEIRARRDLEKAKQTEEEVKKDRKSTEQDITDAIYGTLEAQARVNAATQDTADVAGQKLLDVMTTLAIQAGIYDDYMTHAAGQIRDIAS